MTGFVITIGIGNGVVAFLIRACHGRRSHACAKHRVSAEADILAHSCHNLP